MINLALSLAFIVSFFTSIGGKVLISWIGLPVFQSIPMLLGHLLTALVNYWIPTVIIYAALRLGRAGMWLKITPAIRNMLFAGNLLIVLYITVRILASTVPGGGLAFGVMQLSPIVIVPAQLMIYGALIWLAIRSFRLRREPPADSYRPFRRQEAAAAALLIAIPTAVLAIPLAVIDGSPLQLASEASKRFEDRCKSAGIKINERPSNVEGVYLDKDVGVAYSLSEGRYSGSTSSVMGSGLLHGGWFKFYETRERNPLPDVLVSYKKYMRGQPKGESSAELSSEFGVFQKELLDEAESTRLKLRGTEVSVKNLKTGQVTATLTYFVDERHRQICGESSKNVLSTQGFIVDALGASKQPARH